VAATAIAGPQGQVDIVFDMTTPTVAASEKFSIKVTRAFRVVGARVICKTAAVNGLIDVLKGASSITGNIACATLNTVADAAAVDAAFATFAVGDTLNVTASAVAAGVRGTIIVQTAPLPLADQATLTGT
jgi:hypothetical protein